jgi:hypothetical protein
MKQRLLPARRPPRLTLGVRAAIAAVATIAAIGTLVLLPAPAAGADELTDLTAILAHYPATDEAQGALELQLSRHSTEESWSDQSRVTVEVEEGPQGIKVGLPRVTSRQALQELRAQTLDPNKRTPTYNALQVLTLNEAAGDLDCAAQLAQDISLSHLVEVKPATYLGKPARQLVLTLPPRLSGEARKHIKTADSQLTIWVGADGTPLGAEKIDHTRGRFLVLFFESERKQTWVFGHRGPRLFATRHEVSDTASGMGQDYRSSTVAILTLR